MSKPTAVILLCEDNLTSIFLRSYLKRHGIYHGLRVTVSPKGRGAAENWVIQHYPRQVNAYIKQRARTETWLIVSVDADTGTVAGHIEQLNASLRQSGNQRLRDINFNNEAIARLVPRRNIETWILVLTGATVNEVDDYSRSKDKDAWHELVHPASHELHGWTRPNAQIPDRCTESLHHAIHELNRLELDRRVAR
jgi:hypothetical protein